jgi:hypothetical protein
VIWLRWASLSWALLPRKVALLGTAPAAHQPDCNRLPGLRRGAVGSAFRSTPSGLSGGFVWPSASEGAVSLTLACLLEGIDWRGRPVYGATKERGLIGAEAVFCPCGRGRPYRFSLVVVLAQPGGLQRVCRPMGLVCLPIRLADCRE